LNGRSLSLNRLKWTKFITLWHPKAIDSLGKIMWGEDIILGEGNAGRCVYEGRKAETEKEKNRTEKKEPNMNTIM